MCIICLKPLDATDFPTKILEYCSEKNTHGAGFAFYTAGGTWKVQKGFMKFEHFIDAYRKHKFTTEDCVVAHFRVATSGLKDGGNTHPFPIVDDKEEMRRTEFETNAIAFHNGTVGTGGDRFSDTMEHVADYLFPLLPIWQDNRVSDKIAEAVLTKNSSRWLVCIDNLYYKYGYWYKKDGRLYSNANYEETPPIVYAYNGYKHDYSAVYPGGGWKTTNGLGVAYPLGVAPKPGVDEDYDAIIAKDGIGLPTGNDWGHAFKDGFHGFWKGFKFTTWKKYRQDGRWLPVGDKDTQPPTKLETATKEILAVANSSDFLQRYMITYEPISTTVGKIMVMNWKKYATDQQMLRIAAKRATENRHQAVAEKEAIRHGVKPDDLVDAIIKDDGSFTWNENKKKAEVLDADVKDMLLCPSCLTDDKLDVSPFTLGTHICLYCGCVFSYRTGYIHMHDPEIKKKYETRKAVTVGV